MKKVLILCIFFLISFAVGAGPLDFVVLLDISESMFPFFDDTINYLIGDLLKQHLVDSDGFHLLTFADYPEIEMTLEVKGEAEVAMALDRVVLLQPLGQYTDLVSALRFVYSYTSTVREDSAKKILILTDGIHDPPPGSPYPVSENAYREVTAEVAGKIKKKGWDITLVQFPVSTAMPPEADSADGTAETDSADGMETTSAGTDAGTDAGADAGADAGTSVSGTSVDDAKATGEDADVSVSDGVDLYTDLSKDLDVEVVPYDDSQAASTHGALGAPELVFPDDLGRVGYSFTLPLLVRNTTDEKILIKLSELAWNGVDILRSDVRVTVMPEKSAKLRAKVTIPASVESGPMTMELTAGFADDLRIYPRTGSVSLTLRGTRTSGERKSLNILPVLGYTALGLGGIIVLTFIVFALRGLLLRAFTSTGVPVSRGSSGAVRERAIEMYVEGQNPNIGTRNVNYVRKNGSATIGGGFSTFLIYLYKLPSRIGLISRKGNSYTFRQLKSDYFESNAGTINDCLEKEIVVLSENGRKIKVRFRRYVSELERINSIMRSVKAGRGSFE